MGHNVLRRHCLARRPAKRIAYPKPRYANPRRLGAFAHVPHPAVNLAAG